MSEIRSVSVHLDADVASYIAKMRLAGAETDKAFGHTRGIEQTNSKLQTTESTLGGVERGATKAESSVRRLEGTMSRAGSNGNGLSRMASKLDSFVGKLGLVPALALTTTSALIPLAAAGAGVAAAFAAPLVFTGGALTLFGFLGGAAIKQTQKQYKQIGTLQKAVDSARLSLELSTRSAGKNASMSVTVANAQTRYNKALLAYHQALKGISPQQRQFHGALENLQSDFGKLIRGPVGQDLLAPFTQGLKVADDLLPHATPLIKVVSSDLGELLSELDHYVSSPSFSRLIRGIAHQVGPDLLQFGHMLGSAGDGIGHLLLFLGKRLSPGLMHDLTHLTGEFDHWATSKQGRKDVEDFIGYVHKVGPDAAHAVESLARGSAHLVHALAPLGPPTLHVIKGIADAVSGIPTGTLTTLAKTAAGLVVFQKLGGFKVAKFAYGGSGRGGLGGLGGGGLGGVASGVVPVYVTNAGFGAPGGVPGGGAPPLVTVPTGAAGELLTREQAVSKAAQGAFDAVEGTVLAKSLAAARAAKEAGALWDDGAAKLALSGGKIVGLTGLLRTVLGAPLPALGSSVLTHEHGVDLNHVGSEADFLKTLPGIKATGTAVEALHKRLATASRDMELVGHSADRAFGGGAKDVEKLGSKLNSVKGGHASQQLDLIRHSADQATAKAGADVDHLQSKVNSLHGPKPINIKADTAAAEAALRRVYADLAVIRSKTITVTTAHVTGGSVKAGNASGGYITGPGGPTSDDIPAWLSNGEYVVKASAVRHYGLGFMHAVNANRYASGGPVATHTSSTPAGQYAGMSAEARGVAIELHHLRGSLAATRHELDLERQQRQQLAQARAQLVSTVRDNFRNPLFTAGQNGIWGVAADPLSILRQDIAGARSYRTDLRRLHRRGLRGGALAEVQTLAQAEQAMGLSAREDREISRLYGVRQRASRAAGAAAGNARYGAQLASIDGRIAETNRRLHGVEAAVKHHEAEQKKNAHHVTQGVTKGVNGAVANGVRRGANP